MNNENKICTGGCLCGARRYEFEGNPTHSGNCHCNMFKRATGGAFAVLVQARRDKLRWTKEKPDAYRSSPIATRGFCPGCGSPLFLQYDDDDLIRVTVGCSIDPKTFDRPGTTASKPVFLEPTLGPCPDAACSAEKWRLRRYGTRSN